MEIQTLLNIIEVVVCLGLIVTILMQQKEGGLGTMFGGGGGGEGYRSKRGLEALLSNMTVVLIVIFIANSLAIALLNY